MEGLLVATTTATKWINHKEILTHDTKCTNITATARILSKVTTKTKKQMRMKAFMIYFPDKQKGQRQGISFLE